jgi:CheY-like chemotaxis protein
MALRDRISSFLRPAAHDSRIVDQAPAVAAAEIVRRFWPFARPYRRWIALGLLLLLLVPTIDAIEIYLFKLVVDDVLVPQELAALVPIAVAYVGLASTCSSLDLGLPALDGLSVLRTMREQGRRMPVVILSARDKIDDKVVGLEHGADDYLTKPFRFEELLARVRARLRDAGAAEQTVPRAREVGLDLRTRRAHVDGRAIEPSAREFTMLEVSCATRGRCSAASSSCHTCGATTSTPARTSSTSTSATCAESSDATAS